MSRFIYIASDCPLSPRPNPHEKMMSVNEAIIAGVTDIPDILLRDDFDKDKPGVIMVSDRNVYIDIDTGTITDGDFDDDFDIWIPENSLDLKSNKKYFAVLEWHRLTEGRAENIIKYISDILKTTDEVELWHIWLGSDDLYHSLKSKKILLSDLTPEHIIQLEKRKIWDDVVINDIEIIYDHCYIITK